MNQAKMPAMKARPLRRMRRRSWPACWMNPKILSEITGNTHGIRFRMKPPMNPKSRYFQKASDVGGDAIETLGAFNDQALRPAPFSVWPKTTIPFNAETFLSAVSIGTRKMILPSPVRSVFGWATTTFASGNGKKSAAG